MSAIARDLLGKRMREEPSLSSDGQNKETEKLAEVGTRWKQLQVITYRPLAMLFI